MKRGFSLIELIFAIVIIGISVAALPRIIQQTQQSNEFALKQELTLNAKTMMGSILKEPWDSSALKQECDNVGSTICSNIKLYPWTTPIYNIALGGTDGTRVGIVGLSGIGGRIDRNPDLGKNWQVANKAEFKNKSYGRGSKNDIDDYDNTSFIIGANASAGDFLTQTRISIAVDYVNQTLETGNYRNSNDITINLDSTNTTESTTPTNIKRIIVTATDVNNPNPSHSISLTTYSFNIGNAPAVYQRDWNSPTVAVTPTPPAPGVTP
ncbi:type II secretion system protein [Campylobacter geochelonis]|uniref:type II secretion system protein n=1 Tax=Campylobacter geochelonis TaxID=1780362 RepID=UPI0007706FC1|nr:type II secretion system protein [Campylobacter geochelonis]CZE47615.1 prepilin-type N-terminal cleavage/methylation domain-containing protein [Campylobacter geochelonis]